MLTAPMQHESSSGLRGADVLICVDPAQIDRIWLHVEPFIARAYQHSMGDDDGSSINADLKSRNALLWIVWDGIGILAAAVTKLVTVPGKKLGVITCVAGRDLHRWQHFIRDLERYFKAEGCTHVRMHGREGWKRIFPDYHEPWATLEKVI